MPKKKKAKRSTISTGSKTRKRVSKKERARSKDTLLIILGGVAILAMFALITS